MEFKLLADDIEEALVANRHQVIPLSSPLKNTFVAFFNLAKLAYMLLAARKITTYVAILSITSCDAAAS